MDFQTSTFTESRMSQLIELINKARDTQEAKFQKLLDDKINIPKPVRTEASTSQKYIRDNLTSEGDRDKTFPRIMKYTDKDFIGGSFARHTKIKPLDDIDIYFPIDGHGLTFTHDGVTYSVFSDGVLTENPILDKRWTVGSNISSDKMINEFCKTLRRWYPNSVVKPDGQAVTVRLSSVAVQNENDPGLGFDIVPCFYVKDNDSTDHNFYVIADGKGGWTRTNPRVDSNVNEILHSFHNEFYRPIVKLIKYWNEKHFNGKIGSFYIELTLSRAFDTKPAVTSLTKGLSEAFIELGQVIILEKDAYPWIKNAPVVKAGDLTPQERLLVYNISKKAEEAQALFSSFKYAESIAKWREIFKELE